MNTIYQSVSNNIKQKEILNEIFLYLRYDRDNPLPGLAISVLINLAVYGLVFLLIYFFSTVKEAKKKGKDINHVKSEFISKLESAKSVVKSKYSKDQKMQNKLIKRLDKAKEKIKSYQPKKKK